MSGTIVCGVNRSAEAASAARVAGALARRLGSRLELVYATEPRARPEPGVVSAVRQAVQKQLDWNDVEILVVSGGVARVLKATRHALLVVVGTRGEGALRRTLSGSVSAELVRRPSRPVLVVPTGAASSPALHGRAIVCGVRDAGDLPCLRTAARLASGLGLAVTAIHVRRPLRMPVVPAAGAVPVPGLAGPAAPGPARSALPESLRAAIAALCTPVDVRIHTGPPGAELARAAAEEAAAIVAVGACAHSPLGAAIAGSTLHHLLRRGERPLLVCPRSAEDA
jgi:nucleotide-binding universal stress UspA family protein